MDPQVMEVIKLVASLVPFIAIIVALGVGGSVLSTWLRIKNGYPLANSWGMPMHPKKDGETVERIRLLTERERAASGRAWFDQGPARNARADRDRSTDRNWRARSMRSTIDKGGNA